MSTSLDRDTSACAAATLELVFPWWIKRLESFEEEATNNEGRTDLYNWICLQSEDTGGITRSTGEQTVENENQREPATKLIRLEKQPIR